MLKRILIVAVTTLVASFSGALLAGCGGDDDDGGSAAGGAGTTAPAPSPPADNRITDTAFVSAFERITTFKMDSTPNGTWTLISPTVKDTTKSIGELGTFSVYVMKAVDASLAILTLDPADATAKKKLTADADGIYFAKNDSGTYSAAKVFEPNVFVRWQGTEEKKTGDTFDRLSAAVQQAIDEAKAG